MGSPWTTRRPSVATKAWQAALLLLCVVWVIVDGVIGVGSQVWIAMRVLVRMVARA